MTCTVIVGCAFGDEGKGASIDRFSKDADLVVRYNGGNNAGHTVIVGEEVFKLHFVPSGVVHNKRCVMGNGMVINPDGLMKELDEIRAKGIEPNLLISERAHVITDDQLDRDTSDNSKKIGTTKKGIGPCYADKARRTGKRMIDLKNEGHELAKYIGDASLEINKAIDAGKSVLFESAQGVMLDIDHGSYPFVTSSNVAAGAACTGAGIGPKRIDKVIGIVKAYTTRVGEGPFVTELKDEIGDKIREAGKEFGTTTGRPRRCGWLDTLMLRYACRINGIDELVLTKLDVLDGFETLKFCNAYERNGETLTEMPVELEGCKPIYEEMPGWKSSKVKSYDELPPEAKNFLKKISEIAGAPITSVGVGPERSEIIQLP